MVVQESGSMAIMACGVTLGLVALSHAVLHTGRTHVISDAHHTRITRATPSTALLLPPHEVIYPQSAFALNRSSAGVVDVTRAPYFADATGNKDSTHALLNAYNDIWLPVNCSGDPPDVACLTEVGQRILYFPSGVYRVTRSIEFSVQRSWGTMSLDNMIHFQGQNAATTVIRLDDHTPGFHDPLNPRPVISWIQGDNQSNVAMMNTIADMTVDVGVGNPGADALKFTANNCGSVRRVVLCGRGHTGLRLTAGLTGLALTKHVVIRGFNTGVALNSTHPGHVMEHITLDNISGVGVSVYDNQIAIRGMHFTAGLPTAQGVKVCRTGRGMAVVIDSVFDYPASTTNATACALNNNKGFLFVRNVSVNGAVSHAVCNASQGLWPGGDVTIDEWSSRSSLAFMNATVGTLRLPVVETPVVDRSAPNTWADITHYGAVAGDGVDDTACIQAALHSGATTVFFPPGAHGAYMVNTTLVIPPSVSTVELLWSLIETNFSATDTPRSLFRTEGVMAGTHKTTVIHNAHSGAHFEYWIQLNDARSVVLSEILGSHKLAYNTAEGGNLFVEAVCCGGVVSACVNLTNMAMWGRAFDPEANHCDNPKVVVSGANASLWVLGFKTEGPSTDFRVCDGAHVELLGGELNRFRDGVWGFMPSFDVSNAHVSVVAVEFGPNPPTVEIRGRVGATSLNVTQNTFPTRGSAHMDIVMPGWTCC